MAEQEGGHTAVQHVWFEKNFIAASGVSTLEEAAPLWEFSHFARTENGTQKCDVCPTNITWVVVLHNTKNDMYLRIGTVCYDKFLVYLETNKVLPSSLSARKERSRALRSYVLEKFGEYPKGRGSFSSVVGWFKTQKDLPAEVLRGLECIVHLGHTLTEEDGDLFVSYYKQNRLFGLRELLNDRERRFLDAFPYPNRLPRRVRIDDLPKLRRILTSGRIVLANREARRKEALRKEREAAAIAWQDERDVLAEGVSIARNTEVLQFDSNAELYFTDPNARRSYRCILSGWGRRNQDVLLQDLKATIGTSAKFIATDVSRPNLPMLPTLRMDAADIAAWLQRAEAYRRERLAALFAEAIAHAERLVSEHPELYVKGSFKKGTHPRNSKSEWHLRIGAEKFILQNGDTYLENSGEIYVRSMKVIVKDRVYVVARLYLDSTSDKLTWFYNSYYTGKLYGRGPTVFNMPIRHTLEEGGSI